MQAFQIAFASRGIEAHVPIELLRPQLRDPRGPAHQYENETKLMT